ncbi:MAG: response regulator [Treponemataceae bacterium]|nr:response regulator [Treponemataceae bacterium]
MAFSADAFTESFIEETNEHLDTITNGIIALKKDPKDSEPQALILRELHTIKGTSRMLGFPVIERLSHGLEDVFKGIREKQYELSDRIVALSFATCDEIKRAIRQIRAQANDSINVESICGILQKASSGMFFSMDELEPAENDGVEAGNGEEDDSLENITSIRIDISRINDIIRSFDNLIINQFRFKNQLEEFEKKLQAQESGAITELPKQLKEDMLLTENAIFDTQHELLDLRMLPLAMVLTPLRHEIEQEALTLSKNIDFDIPASSFMLDKAILEKLKEILLHLVRNSIDHGIETVEERVAAGKSPNGKISVSSQQIANHIVITIHDDGRGIQYEKIRQKAQSLFPEQKATIAALSEKELQQYLFMSGFSTSAKPTALSGRGVGLDVVRTAMEAVKGQIHIKTAPGQGTTFELTIPLSLATQQGLFVYTGNLKLMIPSHYIVEVLDCDPAGFTLMQGQSYVHLHEELIPVYYLSSITGTAKDEHATSLIVVEYLETQIAIIVDSISQYENVVVNPLPPILGGLQALQGVVYDENYAIIPILNIPDIIRRLKGLLAYDLKKYQSRNINKTHTVLIVDDSVTTRQIEQSIFETAGYKVETAEDGIIALDLLKVKKIDCIVTDIKMPRMDGLVFLSNVRRLEEHASTPVIVVSGVYDPETKEQFINQGAQAFIVKSEFQRGNLLQAAKELLGE